MGMTAAVMEVVVVAVVVVGVTRPVTRGPGGAWRGRGWAMFSWRGTS